MLKYIVSGYIGFDNFGDEAVASVLVQMLENKEASSITLISKNPEKTAELYGCNAVGMFDFLIPLIKSDVLISGGGSLLQDVTSLKSLLYYISIILAALFFRKKVYIFAQGITPFRTKIGEFLTKFVLKRCSGISVRDAKSKDILDEWGISSDLVVDPAFALSVPNNEKSTSVGIQLRPCKQLNEDFLLLLADSLTEYFKDRQFILFSLQDSMDLEIITKFNQLLTERNLKTTILSGLTVDKCTEELSKLEYLIGMRFHSCLIASKSNVKVLGINYDVKVKTLSEMIGFPIIDCESQDLKQGFEKMIDSNPQDYKIPNFVYPNIIG
ncbi:MAG: polysaccharide pyruvyl transferase CsaB [bacterium]|nr:polysaccharide pyruvyl transferase CsaB [bacterium]